MKRRTTTDNTYTVIKERGITSCEECGKIHINDVFSACGLLFYDKKKQSIFTYRDYFAYGKNTFRGAEVKCTFKCSPFSGMCVDKCRMVDGYHSGVIRHTDIYETLYKSFEIKRYNIDGYSNAIELRDDLFGDESEFRHAIARCNDNGHFADFIDPNWKVYRLYFMEACLSEEFMHYIVEIPILSLQAHRCAFAIDNYGIIYEVDDRIRKSLLFNGSGGLEKLVSIVTGVDEIYYKWK